MELNDLVKGKEISYKGGSFLSIERDLKNIEDNPIKQYLLSNQEELHLDKIRKTFYKLKKIPKREMLFFDVETCGFSYNCPIFAIGMTHLNHNIVTSCFFARDYSEEKTVLKYFVDMLPNYHAFLTYNGLAFDLTRVDKRLIANGLRTTEEGTLKKALEMSHLDLKQELSSMRKLNLPDLKLQTVEKILFGMTRENDIPSSEIPIVYNNYMKREKETKMANVINHVMTDTLSLPAILAYVVKESERRGR